MEPVELARPEKRRENACRPASDQRLRGGLNVYLSRTSSVGKEEAGFRLPPTGLARRPRRSCGVSIGLLGVSRGFSRRGTSSAPVDFRISFERLMSSDVSQWTDSKIPPFNRRPS